MKRRYLAILVAFLICAVYWSVIGCSKTDSIGSKDTRSAGRVRAYPPPIEEWKTVVKEVNGIITDFSEELSQTCDQAYDDIVEEDQYYKKVKERLYFSIEEDRRDAEERMKESQRQILKLCRKSKTLSMSFTLKQTLLSSEGLRV
jgi:hypothetical protein